MCFFYRLRPTENVYFLPPVEPLIIRANGPVDMDGPWGGGEGGGGTRRGRQAVVAGGTSRPTSLFNIIFITLALDSLDVTGRFDCCDTHTGGA